MPRILFSVAFRLLPWRQIKLARRPGSFKVHTPDSASNMIAQMGKDVKGALPSNPPPISTPPIQLSVEDTPTPFRV